MTAKRVLYERRVIRGKDGRRRIVYRRARDDGDASARARDGAPSPTLTAGETPLDGGTPHAKRVLNNSGDLRVNRAAVYSTWFRAVGTMGSLDEMRGGHSPDLMRDDIEDAPAAAAFYSNEGTVLGRVKWDGIRPLDELIADLNTKLQYEGEEVRGFDFRDVYERWEYRYQVVETFGGRGGYSKVVSQIVVEHRACRPRRKGWASR